MLWLFIYFRSVFVVCSLLRFVANFLVFTSFSSYHSSPKNKNNHCIAAFKARKVCCERLKVCNVFCVKIKSINVHGDNVRLHVVVYTQLARCENSCCLRRVNVPQVVQYFFYGIFSKCLSLSLRYTCTIYA